MKNYYAFVEDFKKFMRFFKLFYPELYAKYSHCISMPAIGVDTPRINEDLPLSEVARAVLTHIITEFYIVRCN